MTSKDWKTYKIGDFVTIKHGYAFKGEHIIPEDNGIVLVTPGNFAIGGGFQELKCKYYNGEYPQEYILKHNDLIVTMTDLSKEGDTLGYCAKIPDNKNKIYLHNQRIGLLEFKSDKIIKDFLYWYMRTKHYQRTVVSSCSGSVIKHTSPSRICEIEIPIPPLEIQEKIAKVLSSLDDKIELNNKINQNLEQQTQAIFKSWFVDFEPFGGKMPEDWRIGKLGELVEITSGKRPQLKQVDKDNKFDIPIIGASNIMGYTNAVLYNEPILITGRVGTHGIINKYNKQCWPSDNTLVIKSEYYEYIYQQLKRVNFAGLNRGSTQPLITQKDLFDVPIVIPSFQEIKEYEQFATQLNVYQDNLIAENEKLKQLRDTLLPKLMSGEIDVDKVEV